jgi:hypothetical protein
MPCREVYDDTNLSHEIFINRASTSKRHHFLYETDAITMSQFQVANQSMDESIIWSVRAVSIPEVKSLVRHSKYTPEHVASLFNVSIERAKDILFMSTQHNICQRVYPLTRRYAINHLIPNFHALGGKWTLDFLVSTVKSTRQHVGAFVFSNGNFVAAYPAMSCNDENSTKALRQFANNIGIPAHLRFDMAPGFVGKQTSFQSLIHKLQVNMTNSEPGHHNQLQQVDVAIRDLKHCWRHSMSTKNTPKRLWCFGLEYQEKLMQFIPWGQNKRSGYKQITGHTPDISEYCNFGFYDPVWYWPNTHPALTKNSQELAQLMGVAHKVGSEMCYWLMPISGIPVANMTIQHVTLEETRNPDIQVQIEAFDKALVEQLNDTNHTIGIGVCVADIYLDDNYRDSYGNEGLDPEQI